MLPPGGPMSSNVTLCVAPENCHVTAPPPWSVTVAGLNREPAVEITIGLGTPGAAGGAAGGAGGADGVAGFPGSWAWAGWGAAPPPPQPGVRSAMNIVTR